MTHLTQDPAWQSQLSEPCPQEKVPWHKRFSRRCPSCQGKCFESSETSAGQESRFLLKPTYQWQGEKKCYLFISRTWLSVKSSGKTEVAVIPIRKAALLIYCIFKKHSVIATGQCADTVWHNRGRKPGQGPTFFASHPSLLHLLPPQHTTATPPENANVGIGFCSRWSVKGRVV